MVNSEAQATPVGTPRAKEDGGVLDILNAEDVFVDVPDAPDAAETEDFTPVDDDTTKKLKATRIGTAILHVGVPNPDWGQSLRGVSNRPLMRKSVNELKDNMRGKIRRVQPNERLWITVPREHLEEACKYTVEHYPTQGPLGTWEELLGLITAKCDSDTFEDYPVLMWPPHLPEPPLDRGQHRTLALLEMNPKERSKPITPENLHKVGWVMEISDQALMTKPLIMAIRVNKADLYTEASQADHFMVAAAVLPQLGRAKINDITKDQNSVENWLKSEVGINPTKINGYGRFKALLFHNVWRVLAYDFISFKWGRQEFKISNWEKAIGCRLHEIWKNFLATCYGIHKECFGDGMHHVSVEDLDLIASVKLPRSQHADELRRLFFPMSGDKATKTLPVEQAWFDGSSNVLMYPAKVDGSTYKWRRPGFLEGIHDDKDYIYAFKYLKVNGKTTLPHPKSIQNQLAFVAKAMYHLGQQTIYFVNPEFKMPYVSADALKTFELTYAIRDAYFPPAGVGDSDSDSESDDAFLRGRAPANAVDAEHEHTLQTQHFLRSLRSMVEKNFTKWKPLIENKMGVSPELKGKLPKVERDNYRLRFRDEPWNSFLKLVVREFGTKRFKGVMSVYRHWPDWVNDQMNVQRPLEAKTKSIYRSLAPQRFPHVNAMVKADLAGAVAKATEIVARAVEYRHLISLINDAEKSSTDDEDAVATPPRPGGKGRAKAPVAIADAKELRKAKDLKAKMAQELRQFGFTLEADTDDTGDLPFIPNLDKNVDHQDEPDSDYDEIGNAPLSAPPKSAKGRGGKFKSSDVVDADDDLGDDQKSKKRKTTAGNKDPRDKKKAKIVADKVKKPSKAEAKAQKAQAKARKRSHEDDDNEEVEDLTGSDHSSSGELPDFEPLSPTTRPMNRQKSTTQELRQRPATTQGEVTYYGSDGEQISAEDFELIEASRQLPAETKQTLAAVNLGSSTAPSSSPARPASSRTSRPTTPIRQPTPTVLNPGSMTAPLTNSSTPKNPGPNGPATGSLRVKFAPDPPPSTKSDDARADELPGQRSSRAAKVRSQELSQAQLQSEKQIEEEDKTRLRRVLPETKAKRTKRKRDGLA